LFCLGDVAGVAVGVIPDRTAGATVADRTLMDTQMTNDLTTPDPGLYFYNIENIAQIIYYTPKIFTNKKKR